MLVKRLEDKAGMLRSGFLGGSGGLQQIRAPTEIWAVKTVLEVSHGTRTLLGTELGMFMSHSAESLSFLTRLELGRLLPLLKVN